MLFLKHTRQVLEMEMVFLKLFYTTFKLRINNEKMEKMKTGSFFSGGGLSTLWGLKTP